MGELDNLFSDLTPETVQELSLIEERVKIHLKHTAEGIVATGGELLKAKERLGHGRFLSWVKVKFEMSNQSALRCMQVYERFGDKNNNLLNLGTSVLYLLSERSTPDEVVNEVLTRTEAGETLTVEQVRSLKMQLKAKEAVAKQELERAEKFKSENYQLLDSVADLKSKLAEQPKEVVKEVVREVKVEVVKEVIPEGYTSVEQAIAEVSGFGRR
ncbi:MAG: DUF3102 domain-containing protein [Nitrospirae bacterium]|nr:DUF3102 domain-containing protein [Nitrospirota bacterium]